ncbi:MAG TPA: hypothetical protein VKB65_02505 [Myxococcota bacterium]|nr:hypothetical protein [Myxococcota bacterium]
MSRDRSCPVCDADLLFAGDEVQGDTVICGYCGAPFTVRKVASDDEDWDLEDDF